MGFQFSNLSLKELLYFPKFFFFKYISIYYDYNSHKRSVGLLKNIEQHRKKISIYATVFMNDFKIF